MASPVQVILFLIMPENMTQCIPFLASKATISQTTDKLATIGCTRKENSTITKELIGIIKTFSKLFSEKATFILCRIAVFALEIKSNYRRSLSKSSKTYTRLYIFRIYNQYGKL